MIMPDARGFTDTRIDKQDRDIRPSFPVRSRSRGSAAAVHLKGTSEIRWDYQRENSHKRVSNSVLNWVLEGAWTTVGGRSSHAAIIRNEKKFCLMKVRALSLKIFLPCPRRVLSEATILQEKWVKRRDTRFVVHGIEADSHFRNRLPDALNESYVFRTVGGDFSNFHSQMEDPNFPHIPIERTLAIIKPEAIRFSDEIEEKILQNQFFIIQKRRVHLTPEQASEFYAEHYGKMFFPTLVSYMSSGPISVLVLAKENAVMSWQKLIGPANSVKARSLAPTSLRALYGIDDQQNALHGSDSIASAEKEIRFFFQDTVMEPIPYRVTAKDYLTRHVNPTLLRGLTEVCKQKPKDPIPWLADWLLDNNPNKPSVNNRYTVSKHL
ncbi:NME NM23 member 5 [Clonorchis sinensis]|uniref:Nucleoside diphosphate kinase homolog 5 n=1 Tax=Clonorchis sinensis TaxID=79923 RepID=A0A419PKT7_CLOSI|nr:NME NM23 member 5 [Clonorchis sinensis]